MGRNKPYGELQKKIGEEQWQDIVKRWGRACEYWRYFLTRHQPELSYTTESPRLQPEEVKFRRWHNFYVLPGKEKDLEAVFKEWLALYKASNFPDGYQVFVGDIGLDLPVYSFYFNAKGPADHYSQTVNNFKLLGEERHSLYEKTMSLLRKTEAINIWRRPDLAYAPA